MDHDVIVIGAGAAGEAVASAGSDLGGRVALVERDLVGGLCAFWACMPSKSLLDSAARRHLGADYPWDRASRRRDWMISRERIDRPDDSHRAKLIEDAGGTVHRGEARIVAPGRVEVRSDGGRPATLEARTLIIAAGSVPVIPRIQGLEEAGYWTSDEGTTLRELPSSILVMGGGAVGVELAQVYARFGVRTTIVQSTERLLPRDHPKSGATLAKQLRDEGVDIRTGVTADRVRTAGPGRIVRLSDGSTVEAAQIMIAIGRRPADLRALGAEEAGATLDERGRATPDHTMAIGDAVYIAGDAAGGQQFTHVADYTGRVAVRAALGHPARADLGSIPRTTFTDPETAAVGISLQEAHESGADAFEVTQEFETTARGYTLEGSHGHITAVVDRDRQTLAGVFAACPRASELIHEAVLAIKHAIPVPVLADTIHAFPTGARVFGGLMAEAAKRLG